MSGEAPGPVPASVAPDWQTLRASVRGAAHRRAGLPNQDAVRIRQRPDRVVLALADGHGSARSFRSQQGARLAVAVAQQVAARATRLDQAPASKRWAEDAWPLELVRDWQAAVDARLARRPFSPAELAPLAPPARGQPAARLGQHAAQCHPDPGGDPVPATR